ncbi:hypothetical protein FSW04_16205 [Baekduia soli]|uniref:Uncharacterized protein n=1 Tax=Baekduia soli TaxID=496014 RepID=A0A5B8U8F3_9ACTN|nr:hypothetical protein [Baekduia soli]QEC48962.1 hypothetical protein FSW04_16205 [Baekduia soli]
MTDPNNPDDARIRVLEAAGHTDAAQLLRALNGMDAPTPQAQNTEPEARTPEQAQRAQGEALLRQLREQTTAPWYDAGGLTEGDAA